MKTKRFAIIVALGLVTASCGGGRDASTDSGSTAAASNPPATENPTMEPPETDVPATDSPTTEVATTALATTETPAEQVAPSPTEVERPTSYLVDTEFGPVEVPANPERIVVMDALVALPTALDLGASVYGTLMTDDFGPPLGSMITDAEWAELESVGVLGLPNLEAIAEAAPDLIFASPLSADELDLYNQIAPSVPTVLTNLWRDDARLVAASLGKTDELEVQLAEFDARATTLAQRIDDELGDPTFAFVRIRPDSIRVHTSVHFAGNILSDVGVRMPDQWVRELIEGDVAANLGQRIERLSPELVGDLAAADHLLVLVQGTSKQTAEEVDTAFTTVEESGLWQALPAVQNGQVYFVESHWIIGSLRAASLAIADLERFLFQA